MDELVIVKMTQESDHGNFIQLFDKFEETHYDLIEIDRTNLMREPMTMSDVTMKMSAEIKNRYYICSVQKESKDNPATRKKWTQWEILWSFMEEQVEVSRRWVRNSPSSPTKETNVKTNVTNTVPIKDKQAAFKPCPA